MKKHTTQPDSATHVAETSPQLFDDWFDPIEFGVRSRVRDFIETMMEEELDAVLSRPRYGRIAPDAGKEASMAERGVTGHRHGHRSRSLLGTFGPVEVAMPRARLNSPDGGKTECKSKALKAYQRRTVAADAVIAATSPGGLFVSPCPRQPAALVRRFGDEPGSRSVFLNGRRFLDGSACVARVGPLSSCPVRRTPTSGARRVLRQINEPAASNEESAPVILLPRTTASTCIEPARALTVEMFRAHILTLSKNDDRDGNVGAAEKPAADACSDSGASAPVRRHVSAASGQGSAPVRGEPVAHPV